MYVVGTCLKRKLLSPTLVSTEPCHLLCNRGAHNHSLRCTWEPIYRYLNGACIASVPEVPTWNFQKYPCSEICPLFLLMVIHGPAQCRLMTSRNQPVKDLDASVLCIVHWLLDCGCDVRDVVL